MTQIVEEEQDEINSDLFESFQHDHDGHDHQRSTHSHSVASNVEFENHNDNDGHVHEKKEINIKNESKWTLIMLNLAFLT